MRGCNRRIVLFYQTDRLRNVTILCRVAYTDWFTEWIDLAALDMAASFFALLSNEKRLPNVTLRQGSDA